jgi:two-component system, NtrC family, sensor kinase
MTSATTERSRWELAAESVVVKLRWFGVVMGYILVQTRTGLHDPWAVRAFLALGAGYAALDLAFWWMGEVILKRWPLFVSLMESVFIALLCYHDTGLNSPFRWYYLLSLICCSIRYRAAVAWWTVAFHSLSLLSLSFVLGSPSLWDSSVPLTVTIMAWVTWASSSLAGSLHEAGGELERLNAELAMSRTNLERRVEERTEALRASQARVVQQEKMAAFGLLAAGIAHEVGNPLAALSSLVQILKRRGPDPYTAEKLDLAGRQLHRIERTIRELIDFSRPASRAVSHVRISEVVDESLGIAKYYQRTKERTITTVVPTALPRVVGVRDYLTQVVLNLVLNAIDATDDQGRIHLAARVDPEGFVVLTVEDDGRGISIADRCRLFQPFFTTKAHGTGLGLFVSRQILEDHAGTLTFQSEPGHGSTFFVRLPPERTEAAEPARDHAPEFGPAAESSGSLAPEPTAVVVAAASPGADFP